jgi:hypothetical protein
MPTYQDSHRRPFLRLRIFPLLGGMILYQEMASIWFGAEKKPYGAENIDKESFTITMVPWPDRDPIRKAEDQLPCQLPDKAVCQ